MKSIKLCLYLLFVATISTRCCCERPPAINLTSEEQAWLPYQMGDTIKFAGSLNDTIIFGVEKRQFFRSINKSNPKDRCKDAYVNALNVEFNDGKPTTNFNLEFTVGRNDDSSYLAFHSFRFYPRNSILIDNLKVGGYNYEHVSVFTIDTSSLKAIIPYKFYFIPNVGLIKFDLYNIDKSYEIIK